MDLQKEDGPCHIRVLLKMKKKKTTTTRTTKTNCLIHAFCFLLSALFLLICRNQTAVWTVPENGNIQDDILKEDIVFQHALPLFSVMRWSCELLRHSACLSLLTFIG